MNKKEYPAKVGGKVFSTIYGNGTIVKTNSEYLVVAFVELNHLVVYNLNGIRQGQDNQLLPDLFPNKEEAKRYISAVLESEITPLFFNGEYSDEYFIIKKRDVTLLVYNRTHTLAYISDGIVTINSKYLDEHEQAILTFTGFRSKRSFQKAIDKGKIELSE